MENIEQYDDELGGGGNVYDRGDRPSPRESATIYSEGYETEGQDSNMWRIAVDSRGVHRWQKVSGSSAPKKPAGDEIDRIIAKFRSDNFKSITADDLNKLDEEVNFTVDTGGFGGGLTRIGISHFAERWREEIFERINYISPKRLTRQEQIQYSESTQKKEDEEKSDKELSNRILEAYGEKYNEMPSRFIKAHQLNKDTIHCQIYPFSETGRRDYETFKNIDEVINELHKITEKDKRTQNPKSVEIAQRDNASIIGFKKKETEIPAFEKDDYAILNIDYFGFAKGMIGAIKSVHEKDHQTSRDEYANVFFGRRQDGTEVHKKIELYALDKVNKPVHTVHGENKEWHFEIEKTKQNKNMETKDKTNQPPKYWMGGVKEKDDFQDKITDTFIDAQTVHGSSWAVMTPASYKLHSRGLDQGLGQMYKKQANGKWLKVEPKLEEEPETKKQYVAKYNNGEDIKYGDIVKTSSLNIPRKYSNLKFKVIEVPNSSENNVGVRGVSNETAPYFVNIDSLTFLQREKNEKQEEHKKPIEPSFAFYKGTDFKYANLYDQNKAIEELIDAKVKYEYEKASSLKLLVITQNNLTAEETIFLDKYAGYGGLEKFGAKGVGLFYEYFTPDEIVKFMWGLAYKYGFKDGRRVLEPSVGTGRFFKYTEKTFANTGFEINIYSALISKILYPESSIYHNYFEQAFIKNNLSIKNKLSDIVKHDLVIGNPPYGDISTGASKWFAMGEDKYSKASNYIDYFIFRGLDLLVHGGLLIFIVGAEKHAGGSLFLEKGNNKTKEMIAEKAELIDAYKLPAKLFETTGVSTEVIVLRRTK